MDDQDKPTRSLGSVESQWGKVDAEHFGYESDEDRKSKRGLEDWELVEKIPESQKPVPYWFFAVVVVVLLVGIGLPLVRLGLPGRHCLHCGGRLLRLAHGPHVRLIEGRSIGLGR